MRAFQSTGSFPEHDHLELGAEVRSRRLNVGLLGDRKPITCNILLTSQDTH